MLNLPVSFLFPLPTREPPSDPQENHCLAHQTLCLGKTLLLSPEEKGWMRGVCVNKYPPRSLQVNTAVTQ